MLSSPTTVKSLWHKHQSHTPLDYIPSSTSYQLCDPQHKLNQSASVSLSTNEESNSANLTSLSEEEVSK